MALPAEDRTAITELVYLHGHLIDGGELNRLDELFTPDVVYDVTDLGQEPLRGIDELRQAALALGDLNPVGHHVTNLVLTEVGADRVRARSKGIGINADGTCGSVTYDDDIVRTRDGWRIAYRRVAARRTPLGRQP
ncbi:nuclear transport factor 2 family protein [Streptomyces sp. B6B3]|uniref:nuclear transport factor 2 family protein n=1 Tax=Streptomyces sp. B6B3 TaxID=3153570 RepID=UPI00325F6B3E